MTDFVEYRASVARKSAAGWGGEAAAESGDAELFEVCSAARAAVRAFDEAARRGDPFAALCELSIKEQRAMKAAAVVKTSTPKGIAEKAMLLECYFNAVGRRDVSEETFDVAVSLAADALALAKTMIRSPPQRRDISNPARS